MKVHVAPAGRLEVAEAMDYLDDRREALGDEFYAAFEAALREIAAHPLRWPEATPGYRRDRLSRFRYHVIYRRRGSAIDVVAVAHTARRPGYWMDRLD